MTDGGWSRFRVDVGPWRRYPDFRLLLAARGITALGSSITMVAAPLQVARMTGSFWLTGLLGAAEFLPNVVCGLWGGAIADAHDRRRVVLLAEAVLLVLSAVLLFNALLPTPQVWLVFVVAAGIAGAGAIQRPSNDALIPRVVRHDDLAAASALEGLVGNGAFIIAPALGGLLASASMPLAYTLDVASFVASLALLVRLAPAPPTDPSARPDLGAVVAGLRYAVSRRDLLGCYAVDISAMAFAFPEALFPFLAGELHRPGALGLLYSAGSVGSAVAAATSGWTSRVHRHGWAIILAALGWGVAMAIAGVMPSLWLILLFLALAGAADMISGVFRSTLWNQTIPDELRGRLAGIELLGYTSGPTLGNARAGAVAAFGGTRLAIWSGGLLCMAAVGAVATALPSFRRYDARTDPYALARRETESYAAVQEP